MRYDKYIQRAYETACRHGFHDKEMPKEHYLMLAITEIAEMVEADRHGKHAQMEMFKREIVTPQPKGHRRKHWRFCFEAFIKDTVEDELADVCIRLFDLAGLMGWKIEVGHSEKLEEHYLSIFQHHTFTECAWKLCRELAPLYDFNELDINVVLYYIECWSRFLVIDLEWHINQKMKYNEQRARLHGKKY